MPLPPDIATTLSNEARLRVAREKIARLTGAKSALTSLIQSLSGVSNDTDSLLSQARQNLTTLESGAGQGVAGDVGPYSPMDQALQEERDAGKSALVDFVKANPECIEEDAITQWRISALTGRPPDRQWLLQDPGAIRQEYSATLMDYVDADGVHHQYLPDMTWESFRAFVIATDKPTLMSM